LQGYQEIARGSEREPVTLLRQHAVTGGYTIERGSRRRLGALLLSVYRGKDLVYIGHTGTGFNQRTLADVREPQCA
jgi:bifunctional non-homologous end joining protein LigD